VMGAVEDIGTKIGATLFLPEEQKKARREELVAGQDSRQVKVRPQALCAGRAITTVA
jgi:hypothetical protein